MLVMKFGGTSVQSATAMQTVIDIVRSTTDDKKVVVASACSGVTNSLIELAGYAAIADTDAVNKAVTSLTERHHTVCQELLFESSLLAPTMARIDALCTELRTLCEGIALLRECTERSRALLLSFGERLSTTILAAGLQATGTSATLVDVRVVMRTNSDYLEARATMSDVEKLAALHLRPLTDRGEIVVTQGFIGADARARTTVLGRGGSDLSAAILGAALDAREIQIWTDVSGICTTDPRIVPDARAVPTMSFAEAGELAYFGAKVLHPDTIRPAIEKGIPVRVLNTFRPQDGGTLLTPQVENADGGIRAVALRRECIMISLVMKPDQNKVRCMAALYATMERLGIETFAAEGAERHYSFYTTGRPAAEVLCRELQPYAQCTIEPIAIICACAPRTTGEHTSALPEIATALAPFSPISLIQCANNITVLAAVREEYADNALRTVHTLIRMKQVEDRTVPV